MQLPPRQQTIGTIGVALLFAAIPAIYGLSEASVSALALWFILMVAVAAGLLMVGYGVTADRLGLFRDVVHNRYSLSRLQVVLWSIVVIAGFVASIFSNLASGHGASVSLPGELWAVLGISYATAGGALYVKNKKDKQTDIEDLDPEATADRLGDRFETFRGRSVVMNRPHLLDLVHGEQGNGGEVDIGKAQMLLFTVLLVFTYAVAIGERLSSGAGIDSLPPIDESLAGLLALSHAGYLGYKEMPQSGAKRAAASTPASAAQPPADSNDDTSDALAGDPQGAQD